MTSKAELPNASPEIFLLSLEKLASFDEMFTNLIDILAARATIKRATQSDSALRYLARNTPSAILITDPGPFRPKNSTVIDQVKAYLQDGGTVIVGGNFSSFADAEMYDAFFRAFGVPWKQGDYTRTTVHLNSGAASQLSDHKLSPSYSMKAVHLKGVTQQTALYVPNEESVVESRVFAPENVDTDQSPVAFTAVGKGRLGYVGDVNGEEPSDMVYAALCGL